MSCILYVFPHPDDESFGPAPVLAQQRRQGHEVHLLTLTRGEATTQRHTYGYAKDEMGVVRTEEMKDVAEALDLSSLTVLDFPDGELQDCNPLALEKAVAERIRAVAPEVLVTYAIHGVSGHRDHLVTHALVKRAFCVHRAAGTAPLRRLALFTVAEGAERPSHLQASPPAAIDAIVRFSDADYARAQAALQCYRTYAKVVEKHQPLTTVAEGVCFELFQETHDPPLEDLTEQLPAR